MTKSIISLLCLAGAIALFFFYTKPTYDGLQHIKARITQYDLALDKAAELQRLKQSLLSRYNSFNPSDIDRLHKLLPDHVDNVRLVLDLDTLASKHGLALQNVVISAPENDANSAGSQNTIAPTTQTYDSLTLRFATSGTYQKFVDFLSDIERSLRIVDIVELKITPSLEGAGEPIYRFDIVLRTYWLK
jgi:Tfp pilus assembly protein PilO